MPVISTLCLRVLIVGHLVNIQDPPSTRQSGSPVAWK